MDSVIVEPGISPHRGIPVKSIQSYTSDPIWQTIFEQMPDVCMWIDPLAGRIMGCNAAFSKLLFYEAQEVYGMPVHVLAHPDDLLLSKNAWQAMAQGAELSDADVTVVTKNGISIHVSARASSIRDDDGDVLCGLIVLRDITCRRESELALRESRRQLQALAYELTLVEVRERERIARGLHDDIGQILAMAKFKLAELEQAGVSDRNAQLRAELRDLLSQASRATRSATFELSCPLLQQLGLQAAVESLRDQVVRSGGPAVHVEGRLSDVPVSESVLAVVYRVVRELIVNVQKHAYARHVWVRLWCDQQHLVISLGDDGLGFQVSQLSNYFGPEGGFGLASAEAQMQAIGGRLEIDSARGQGTRARVTLPFADA